MGDCQAMRQKLDFPYNVNLFRVYINLKPQKILLQKTIGNKSIKRIFMEPTKMTTFQNDPLTIRKHPQLSPSNPSHFQLLQNIYQLSAYSLLSADFVSSISSLQYTRLGGQVGCGVAGWVGGLVGVTMILRLILVLN